MSPCLGSVRPFVACRHRSDVIKRVTEIGMVGSIQRARRGGFLEKSKFQFRPTFYFSHLNILTERKLSRFLNVLIDFR